MLRYGTLRTRRGTDAAFMALGPDRPGPAAPVLFVHPINLRKECWLDLFRGLAGDRLCVAVDLSGHGESADDEEFSLAGWVSDGLDAVTSLGLDRVHLVGGSLGGLIALCLAGDLPTRALSVTTMGTDPGSDIADGHGADLLDRVDQNTVEDLFAALAVEAVAPDPPADLVATVRHLTNRHGKPIVRRVLAATQRADANRWLPRVRCPVLVLTGEFDGTCPPQDGRRLAASVGGRHEVLPAVGHLPMLEAAAAVLRLLVPHLDAAERHADAG